MSTDSLLTFKVIRREPEMVRPAAPTPRECKVLSAVDRYLIIRFHVPSIRFYAQAPAMVGIDPVRVIREGLSKALVYYYPLAGRLKELNGDKLVVDCTGEGVVFIEADADVSLEQFGDPLCPPFPGLKDLLFEVPGSAGILDSPLLLIQVTRLKCGGFIFALRFNHMICDLAGIVQFMKAMAELAKGAEAPPVLPVWRRELLEARDPPLVTCEHRGQYDMPDPKGTILPFFGKTHRSYFFYPSEISSLRLRVPPRLQKCSTFEILAACLWRCRTAALRLEPEDHVRLLFTVDIRARLYPPLPVGYYGNAFASTAADISAGELCGKPLGFALDLVRKAKANVTEEFVRSFVDNIALMGEELPVPDIRIFTISDGTRGGYEGVDFGWGKPRYGGPARDFASFFLPTRNREGEIGIIVPVGLPAAAMERFEEELKLILGKEDNKSKLVSRANANQQWAVKIRHWEDEFKSTLQHYWLGTKLLWADARISSRLLVKVFNGKGLSRRERQQLTRTTADIFRLFPVAVFNIVPFMEFLLPVFSKLFPNILPSTFQDKMKEEEALKKRLNARIECAKFLQDTVREMAKEVQNSRSGDIKKTAEDLDEFLNKVRTGAGVSIDEILSFAKLFNDELTLDNISMPRLVNMCKYMGIKPFGTDVYLRFKPQPHPEEMIV